MNTNKIEIEEHRQAHDLCQKIMDNLHEKDLETLKSIARKLDIPIPEPSTCTKPPEKNSVICSPFHFFNQYFGDLNWPATDFAQDLPTLTVDDVFLSEMDSEQLAEARALMQDTQRTRIWNNGQDEYRFEIHEREFVIQVTELFLRPMNCH